MKILWLTLDALLPMHSGGRLGVLKRLENIYHDHEIYLFYFYSDSFEEQCSRQLKTYCQNVRGYKKEKNKIRILLNYLYFPYTVSTRINKRLIKDIDECIEQNKIDLINIDFPQMGYSLLKCHNLSSIKIVMNLHNIEWQRFEEISKSFSISGIKRLISRMEADKLKRFEEKIYKKLNFSAFTFVTLEDKKFFEAWMTDIKATLEIIPGGAVYHPAEVGGIELAHKLVFVGVMSNELNPEGALWFVKNILPKIKEKVPDVEFYIVGKNPIKKLRHLSVPGVYVTGFVDDVSYFYRTASAVVIPILHGGGVKLKLLEAIGYGSIVVSTTMGVKGTNFENGKHILISDDANEFAEYCIDILLNRDKYEKLRLSALDLFKEQYTWEGIGKKYSDFLSGL